ncbi:MAG TPA: S8 family serine peptidase [Gaiellaceae bacterium]|nr:S8 family serine peptidase [Gaiellaceae bacterium]
MTKLAILLASAAALSAATVSAQARPANAPPLANLEPDAAQQWYLTEDQAWSFWTTMPKLATVKVAVLDSGIDAGHPEFIGRIAAGKSFVGGSWKRDPDGHGTFVAGEIAANPTNKLGIAGLAFNAKLLIAKVVDTDTDSVSLSAEVKAIHWAVDNGARVINLSIGGTRDPFDVDHNTYSPAEQMAIGWAYSKGVVIVAAAGNGTESPATPWPYADYPAALPHVIGVSAVRRNGSVPLYSNRDQTYVDLAAPGDAIFSTIPRNLVDKDRPGCAGQPYSNCGPPLYLGAIGTSFAAPQVSAAAALLIGERPSLRPDQVSWLLERTARDDTPATGCSTCARGRDRFTGWGTLDVKAALTRLTSRVPLPGSDAYEPNDDAGVWAHPFGPPRKITATLDYWDDPIDVYSIKLFKGQRLYARLSPSALGGAGLSLWMPGTRHVAGIVNSQFARAPLSERAAGAVAAGRQQRIAFTVAADGVYYLEARLTRPTRNPVAYDLAVATRR